MRMLNLGVMALALASAFLLYGINYDTRMMAQRLQDRERAIERARSDIAVLKAERAHLARRAEASADTFATRTMLDVPPGRSLGQLI